MVQFYGGAKSWNGAIIEKNMYIKTARRTFMSAGCALLFIPTRLSFISENQSVDHHSKPFRGRMKGTFISSAKVLFLSENLAFPFNFQLI